MSWELAAIDDGSSSALAVNERRGSVLTATDNAAYVSMDGGATWQRGARVFADPTGDSRGLFMF